MSWLVPEHVAKLVRRALAAHHFPDVVTDGDATRAVIADWLREQGEDRYANRLGDRSEDFLGDEQDWLKSRLWVLNAIFEAFEKRDAIAELLQRRAEGAAA